MDRSRTDGVASSRVRRTPKRAAATFAALIMVGSLGACAGDQVDDPGQIDTEQDTDAPAGLQDGTRPEQDGSEANDQ